MKVGLLFGSFNPVHVGHLIIANYMANYTDLDKVWLVVSPQNPLKKYGDLINTYDRLEMAKLATDNSRNIKNSNKNVTINSFQNSEQISLQPILSKETTNGLEIDHVH